MRKSLLLVPVLLGALACGGSDDTQGPGAQDGAGNNGTHTIKLEVTGAKKASNIT